MRICWLETAEEQCIEDNQTADELQISEGAMDFADIIGQEGAKRGLEIAASGGHNVILIGSQGCGKSSLAKAMTGILPPMTLEEFDGKQKFFELVSSNSSIGYEGVEQLFKYCIRTQAARTSTEDIVSVSSAPAPCPVQTEKEFLTALFRKMDGVMAAPQQEYADYGELVDDCVLFYGWRKERARMFIEVLVRESKTHFMGVS